MVITANVLLWLPRKYKTLDELSNIQVFIQSSTPVTMSLMTSLITISVLAGLQVCQISSTYTCVSDRLIKCFEDVA